jgi:hypothetical protein
MEPDPAPRHRRLGPDGRYGAAVRLRRPGAYVLAQVDPGTASAVAGSSERVAAYDLPRCEPVHPMRAARVGGVSDWSDNSAPLAALYLRGPDMKPLAVARQ